MSEVTKDDNMGMSSFKVGGPVKGNDGEVYRPKRK